MKLNILVYLVLRLSCDTLLMCLVVDVVNYLLKSSAKRVNVANNEGRTCLHIAALTNNLPLCQLLVEQYNADLNSVMTSQVIVKILQSFVLKLVYFD